MRIVFTGGGTLGSVTPLLAVAEAIRRRDPTVEMAWIGTKGGPEADPVRRAGLEYFGVSSGKLRRYLSWRNFTDVFRILAGFFQCRRLFRRQRPDSLVSAGGFVAVPAVWAARSLGVPVHVHQMDIRPGLANRLSVPFAASVSVAFERSLADFAKHDPVWIGNPVRPAVLSGDRDAGLARFRLAGDRPVVLVLGGGTGALALNALVAKAWEYLKDDIDLIHVTGRGKETALAADDHYRSEPALNAEEMGLAYAAADLVVTRAGMGTLTELAALGKPTAIVPMPGSHQEDNAAFFADKGAAAVWPESELFSKGFADRVRGLLADQDRLGRLGQAMAELNRPDAAERMAGLLLADDSLSGRGASDSRPPTGRGASDSRTSADQGRSDSRPSTGQKPPDSRPPTGRGASDSRMPTGRGASDSRTSADQGRSDSRPSTGQKPPDSRMTPEAMARLTRHGFRDNLSSSLLG